MTRDTFVNDAYTVHSESLAVGYGRHTIVDGIDLRLGKGDLVVLIGTNGSGKSTLLKTLAGLLPALGGKLSVLGGAPGANPKRAAYLPQHPVSSHTLPLRSRDVVDHGCGHLDTSCASLQVSHRPPGEAGASEAGRRGAASPEE